MSDHDRPAAVIDLEAGSVRREIRILATVDAVWSAVTEPVHISRWLGETLLDGQGAGATGTVSWPDRTGIPIRVEEVTPKSRVSYRWSNDDSAATVPAEVELERSTLFTFTLRAVSGGTLLSVVETGFESLTDPPASRASHRRGWDAELDELADLLERS